MNNKSYILTIVATLMSGLILLTLGVLLGRTWQQSRVFSIVGEGVDTQGLIQLQGTISVRGNSQVDADPEIAVLNLGIVACTPDAVESNQIINDGLSSVKNRLIEEGIPEEDILTGFFELRPNYDDSTVICATNGLSVVTEDMEHISDLIDLTIEAGVTNFYSVTFTVRDSSQAREEAIRLAYEDAERQAEQFAQISGQSLGEVLKSQVEIRDYLTKSLPGYRGGGGGTTPHTGEIEATVSLVYEVLSP